MMSSNVEVERNRKHQRARYKVEEENDKPKLVSHVSRNTDSVSPHTFINPLSQSDIPVITSEETPTCHYKTLTYTVFLDLSASYFTFVSMTPAAVNPNFTKSLADLIYFKTDVDSWLTLYFASRSGNYKWKLLELQVVFHAKSKTLQSWVNHIDEYMKTVFRPKNLYFIINPRAGNGTAKKYFSREVEPILKQLHVTYKVHCTKRSKEATEIAEKMRDSIEFDGIVVLSGDGTFNEVLRGLATFDKELNMQPIRIPLGLLPCGTANTLIYSINGIDDRETALLHILLGDKRKADLTTVRNMKGELLGLSQTMVSFGFISDAIRDSEKLKRFLPGTMPYSVSFMKYMMKMKKYKCTIEILKYTSDPTTRIACGSFCQHCLSMSESDEAESLEKVVYDEPTVFGLNIHNFTGKCELSPRGASPYGHIGDGCMDVHIIRDVNRSQVIEMMKDVGLAEDTGKPPFDFIEMIRVKKLRLTNMVEDDDTQKSCFLLDGEIVDQEPAEISNNFQVVTFFARGIEYNQGLTPEAMNHEALNQKESCIKCDFC